MKKLAVYLLFCIIFVVFTYFFVDLNFIYLKNLYSGFFGYRELTSIFYFLLIIIFYGFYFFFLKYLRKSEDKKYFKKILIISLILLTAYPAYVSYDIFNYLATAKVLFFYHENPYIVMPIEFIGDPMLLFTHAANKIALYGPVWLVLTGIPYVLTSWNFLLTLFTFKIFVTLFYLGTIWLLYKWTKNMYAVSLFALNPLVLMETVAAGHNDIVMMFLAVASLYCLKDRKTFFSIILLLLAIFIKYSVIFLIPVYLFALITFYMRKKINWDNVFLLSFISMTIVFFLSPIREEIYPWYAIWFLVFLPFVYKRKFIFHFSLLLSFLLPFRYIPFMLFGNHFGITPILKISMIFVPLAILVSYYILRHRKNILNV